MKILKNKEIKTYLTLSGYYVSYKQIRDKLHFIKISEPSEFLWFFNNYRNSANTNCMKLS